MSMLTGFPPIAERNARVLILGSMPGEISLQKKQYYGHARNAFWPIMERLFAGHSDLTYDQRTVLLKTNAIAIWDVVKSCKRPGSLDADIELDTVINNNFADFFSEHSLVKKVFFNGKKAQQVFDKNILDTLPKRFDYLQFYGLPSTSPAYASMNFQQKLMAWQIVRQACISNEE